MEDTERSRLISINRNHDSGEARSIREVLADIRAGRVHIGPVLLYTLIAVIGSLSIGLVLGYSSLTQYSLNQTGNYTHERFHVKLGFGITDNKYSYFGAIANFAALFAGLIMGVISDRIGRKPSMLISCVPLVFGWSFIAGSYCFITKENEFYTFLMVGRFLTGFGMGCFSLVVPVYILEISPTSLKGFLSTTHQLSIVCGNLVVYSLGIFFKYHIVAMIAGAIGIICAIAILFIPETPRWLLINGKEEKAFDALIKVRGRTADIERDIDTLQNAIEHESEGESTFVEKLFEFKKRSVIWLLVLSLGLMFFQQFSGINAVVFYGADIISSARVPYPLYSASIGMGLLILIPTFINVVLMDVAGRKKLLISGAILMFLGTIYLGTYYFVCRHGHNSGVCASTAFQSTALIALAFFLFGFSIGWGAIPWVMMGELAPLKVRGIMGGIATATNWSLATIVTKFFTSYENLVHPYGIWWTFGGAMFLSIFFVALLLPETKGKALEDIQKENEEKFAKKSLE